MVSKLDNIIIYYLRGTKTEFDFGYYLWRICHRQR